MFKAAATPRGPLLWRPSPQAGASLPVRTRIGIVAGFPLATLLMIRLSDVPTIKERGLPIESQTWFAFLFPKILRVIWKQRSASGPRS